MAARILQDYARASVSMPDVKGLPEPYLSELEELIAIFQSKLSRNILKSRYYDFKNSLKDLGISIPPPLAHNSEFHAVVGWAEKAVSSLESRSRFDGFVGEGSELANLIFDSNSFKKKYPMLATSELTHSVAFASVTRGSNKPVQINLYSACNAAASWDFSNDCIKAGLTITSIDNLNNPTGYNLFSKDAIVSIKLTDPKRNIWSYQIMPHSMGKPLFVAFAYSPSLDRPFGHSRINRAVMSAIDSAVRELCRLEISSEISAAPARYILGASDDLLDDIPQWQAYIGSILAISRDEEGNVPSVGQFPQVDLQQHITVMKLCASRMSGASDIPISSLGISSESNPESADAILAANKELIIKATKLNTCNGDSLTELARMAVAIYQNTSLDNLTMDELDITTKWLSPAYPEPLSMADGMIKMVQAIPWIADSEVILEQFGFDKSDIKRLMSDKRRGEAVSAINALNARSYE